MSGSCLQMCRIRVGWMCMCLCAHHTRVLFRSIFKYLHGFPPRSSLIINTINWIEKISLIFTSPKPPGFSRGQSDLIWVVPVLLLASSRSTEQFWALYFHFRHFSTVPLSLPILNFSLWDFSWFLVISKWFFLALSIALPPSPNYPAPLFHMWCLVKLSAPTGLPFLPRVPIASAPIPPFPFPPSILCCCGRPRLAVVNFCFIL